MFGKPDITMACNGMLAGLVAITAPCAFVSPNAAVIIGILAGIIVCLGVLFNERVLKVDDPCGAISVHGYCGWFGAVSVGIFADGTYGAGWNGVGAATYLGTGRPGRHGSALRRYEPVRLPAHGRDAVRRLRLRLDLRRVQGRECDQVDARVARGRDSKGSTSPSSACPATPRTRCRLSHRGIARARSQEPSRREEGHA